MDTQSHISPSVQQAKLRFGIIGNAPGLIAAVERAIRVAPIDLSVLVVGESGAGKEFFPQIIHSFSSRKHSKYIAVNCGAIPEGTIDSELYGHEKGSFTGAVDSRKGYFEEANGGTIFLDEVAELPLTTQARLLRVLESGEYLRVGSSEVRRTNVRIVAATNVDLPKAIAEGRFREDLYYRLSTVLITVPPLRDRGADIRLLAFKFASDFAERYTTPAITFDAESEALLRHYRWPGNVRQLKNVIDQLALFEAGKTVTPEILRNYLPTVSDSYMPTAPGPDTHTYAREREMLLGMIFNLQRRLDDLQERLDKQPAPKAEHARIFTDNAPEPHIGRSLLALPKEDSNCAEVQYSEVAPGMEISAEPTTPATLEENEREMIRQALERNEGRRKAAAAQLKISERTLYRKIKEYGLE